MPRVARKAPGGLVYHVLNRGNARRTIFDDDGDYVAFVRLLAEAKRRVPGVRVLGFCLMPNHWHLILWPRADGGLSTFMAWLTNAHVRRWHAHRQSTGDGHVYQGRFKSFPVRDDRYLLTALRYVEANPLRANLVRQAQDWPWSSLRARECGETGGVAAADLLDEWPVDRPADWVTLVNEPLSATDATAVRESITRGRPLGDAGWAGRVSRKLGLGHTTRPRGRPRKRTREGGDGAGK